MHIVFTGGGTAGHVIPNLAIADCIAKSGKDVKMTYIGSYNGIESKLVKEYGMDFEAVHTGKLRRYFSWQNFADIFKVPYGVFQAIFKIRKLKPSIIFSKGGFVAIPVVIAGKLLKVPIVIHESDAIAGLATKLSAPFADKILLAYSNALEDLKKYTSKIQVIGSPIRAEVLMGDIEVAKKITGFTGSRPVLLVMGGSSGARQINQIIKKEKEEILKFFDIIHLSGEQNAQPIKEPHYWSFGFVSEELPHFYALANKAISRAGANSLAELEALELPSLIYPLGKFVSRGDQIVNAKASSQKNMFLRVADEKEKALPQLLSLPEKRSSANRQNKTAEDIARILMI